MTDHMMIPPESRLDMISLAEGLTRAGRLSAKDLVRLKSMRQMRLAPLPFLAEQKLSDVSADGEILDMAALLEFLAQQTGLGVFDIDPLKIDTPSVTRVMSSEFARRHQILAVEVNAREILIICSEPYVTSWVSMIEQSQIGKTIVRALASPADIRRYIDEFYAMANSVKKASAQGLAASALGNLEQMVELGQLDSMEANDTHIVNIVDWLLQYAFTQRASKFDWIRPK